MSEPDLFVVCKNCSSEVSPYVTECPYCGQRVRKRAPRIDKGEPELPRRRRGARKLPKLRRDEIPGIAPETRPTATMVLIAISLLTTLAWRSGEVFLVDLGAVYGPVEGEVWRYFATPFLHDNYGYQFVALLATGVFGMLLERRFGWFSVVAIFVLAGAGGAAASEALDFYPVLGANGAALGLLCAWLVDDRRAARRGHDRENDLLGVYVFAAALALLSLADEDARITAAAGGAAVGSLIGLALTSFRR